MLTTDLLFEVAIPRLKQISPPFQCYPFAVQTAFVQAITIRGSTVTLRRSPTTGPYRRNSSSRFSRLSTYRLGSPDSPTTPGAASWRNISRRGPVRRCVRLVKTLFGLSVSFYFTADALLLLAPRDCRGRHSWEVLADRFTVPFQEHLSWWPVVGPKN